MKKQFTVFVLSGDVDHATALRTALVNEGFETFMFKDQDAFIARIKEAAPHLVVFHKSGLSLPVRDFVQKIIEINSEVLFLPICESSDLNEMLRFREFNFVGVCPAGDGVLSRLVWMADEAMKGLFLSYQNEQVHSTMLKTQERIEQIQLESERIQARAEKTTGISLGVEFQKYASAVNKEQVLQIFLKNLNQKFLAKNSKISALYFKFLPTVQSFVAVHSLGVEIESIKGVGGKLTEEEARNPNEMLQSGAVPQMIQELMRDGFSVEKFIFKAIFLTSQLDGFFIIWSEASNVYDEEIENELSLFILVYERGHLYKKIAAMEISDPVTELHNRYHYLQVLDAEVARARRLQKAISVVKLSVDHLPELEQVIGQGGKDQVLRLMATIIKKTSRINDVSCRLAENEFAMILPHAARKGATLRAERLRRMIETQILQSLGQRVTVSLGVSEYPSFCSTPEELDRSVSEALHYIVDKGGNKVCLYRPQENFKPDFAVPAI